MSRYATLAFLLMISASAAFGQQSVSSANATTTAVVTAGISIVKNSDLLFGSVVRPTAAGTVVVAAAGGRTSPTLIFGNGAFNPANFTVFRGGNGNPHYDIVLPNSLTITNGAGGTMTVDTFTSMPVGGGFAQPTQGLNVGATLRVGANQALGTYTGFFAVTVIKN